MIVTQEPIIKRCKCFAKIKVIQRCAKLKGSPWLKDGCYTRTKHLVIQSKEAHLRIKSNKSL